MELEIGTTKLNFFHILTDVAKPTIIFLHDSLGCIELWRDFPQKIGTQTQCNVLVYDRHGYGKSSAFDSEKRTIDYLEKEADVLNSIIEKFKINQAIFLGHSDGGSIAIIAASKYPEKTKGIITEGAHVFVEDITLSGIREAKEAYQKTNLKHKLTKYHGDKVEALFNAWTETWLSQEYKDWNIEKFLPTIYCPVLVIQGEKDEYGSKEQVNSIIYHVKGVSEKYEVPNVGHTPHKESEVLTLSKCAAFIKRINSD